MTPLSDFIPPDALMIDERCTVSEGSLLIKLALLVRNGILILPGMQIFLGNKMHDQLQSLVTLKILQRGVSNLFGPVKL